MGTMCGAPPGESSMTVDDQDWENVQTSTSNAWGATPPSAAPW